MEHVKRKREWKRERETGGGGGGERIMSVLEKAWVVM